MGKSVKGYLKTYPDGTSYFDLSDTMKNNFNNIVYRTNNYTDLWQLGQFVDAYNSKYNTTPDILIPNLLDAQADRRFSKTQNSGLKQVCKYLNSLEANFTIYHPHNPDVVEALIDGVRILKNDEFVRKSLDKILFPIKFDTFKHKSRITNEIECIDLYKWDSSNTILMSPDAGAFKPLISLCNNIGWDGETYSAQKSREYFDGQTKLTQLIDRKDFGGKDIIIVDDICVGGGTFKGLSKLLKERNCGKLFLLVSHMTVANLGRDNVCKYFDNVFTTNSKAYDYHCSYKTRDVGSPTYHNYVPNNLVVIDMF